MRAEDAAGRSSIHDRRRHDVGIQGPAVKRLRYSMYVEQSTTASWLVVALGRGVTELGAPYSGFGWETGMGFWLSQADDVHGQGCWLGYTWVSMSVR